MLAAAVAARGVPSRALRDVVMHERNHAHFRRMQFFFSRLCRPTMGRPGCPHVRFS